VQRLLPKTDLKHERNVRFVHQDDEHILHRPNDLNSTERTDLEMLSNIVVAFVVTSIMAIRGYRKKSLDLSGCLAAYLVGMTHSVIGYDLKTISFGLVCFVILILSPLLSPFCCLLLFFVSSSVLTKKGEKEKALIEADFKPGGQRNWMQVFCNAAPQTALCAVYLSGVGMSERGLSFATPEAAWASSLLIGVFGYAFFHLIVMVSFPFTCFVNYVVFVTSCFTIVFSFSHS
jgi:uncharacterized membrane protein